MNNFVNPNGYISQPMAPLLSRSAEPVSVNGLEGAKAYPMLPNSKAVLFDANEDVFYLRETDSGNFPSIRIFSFTEIKSTPLTEMQYVTLEEFNKFKEEMLNGKQYHQSNAGDVLAGEQCSTGSTNDVVNGAKSESGANATKSSKAKSSIQ